MKLPLLIILALPLLANAQDKLTYEAFGKLFAGGSFDQGVADSLQDMVVVDKADGRYQIAFQRIGGGVDWTPPTTSGFASITGLAVDRFGVQVSDEFAITAPAEGRVTVLRPDRSLDTPIVRNLFPAGPGAALLAGFDVDLAGSSELLVFGTDGGTETRETFAGDSSLWTDVDPVISSRLWSVVAGNARRVLLVADGEVVSARANAFTIGDEKRLPGYVASADTRMAYGLFDGGNDPHVIVFAPGASSATATELLATPVGWGTSQTLNFAKPLELLIAVPTGGGVRLAALYQDQSAQLFDFDGASLGKPTPLPGSHDLLFPLGSNRLLSKSGDSWETFDATTGLPLLQGDIPAIGVGSNVLFVSAEPFADPASAPIFAGQAGNWTTVASGGNDNWTVSALIQTTNGLGGETTQGIKPEPGAGFALVNQYRADVSVSLIGVSPGPANGEVFISPNGGNFLPVEGEPLAVPVSFTSTFPDAEVYYRFNGGGPWLLSDGELTLTMPGVLQAYAEWNGLRSPTREAIFTSQAVLPLAAGGFTDDNANGLSDQLEEAFAIEGGFWDDPDGDGYTTGEELYLDPLNPTDPADGAMFPAGPPAIPANTETPAGGNFVLEWDGNGAATYSVECALGLDGAWIPTGIPPVEEPPGHYTWSDPDPIDDELRKFYRIIVVLNP